jgi:pSer/pThr/pTyr-binding forkhead associated (FHA) protein
MVEQQQPIGGRGVALHLLDSSQGHPVQTWKFAEQSSITIGRSEEQDVVISDPQVSRLHVKLVHQNGRWTLESMGRHGTLIDDRVVAQADLRDHVVFRLGPAGPSLRFDVAEPAFVGATETIDRIDTYAFSMLEVDEERKQAEVEQIAGNALFEELREKSKRFKSLRKDEQD